MRCDVAVLYVDALGPYPQLVSDWYDELRDATSYHGYKPVVAHPPCGPYSKLRKFNKYQDPKHAFHALEVVRANGGVLEHPAGSTFWTVVGLPRQGFDAWGGYTVETQQVRWGHKAVKPTWLYIVGCSLANLPSIPPMRRHTHTCGMSRAPGIKSLSAAGRRRTPVAFAEWLIELASRCRTSTMQLTVQRV